MYPALRSSLVFYSLLVTLAFVIVVTRLRPPPPELAPEQVAAVAGALHELAGWVAFTSPPDDRCRQVTLLQSASPGTYRGLAFAGSGPGSPGGETQLAFALTASTPLPRHSQRRRVPALDLRRFDPASDLVGRRSPHYLALELAIPVEGEEAGVTPLPPLRVDNVTGRNAETRGVVIHRSLASLLGQSGALLTPEDAETLALLGRLVRVWLPPPAPGGMCGEVAVLLYRDTLPSRYRLDVFRLGGERVAVAALRVHAEPGERLPRRLRIEARAGGDGPLAGMRLALVRPEPPQREGTPAVVEVELGVGETVVELEAFLADFRWGEG